MSGGHLPSDAWLPMCNKPDHRALVEQLEVLKSLVQANGFELLEGDFTRRDGTRSPFFLKPINVDRLLALLAQARENERSKPA